MEESIEGASAAAERTTSSPGALHAEVENGRPRRVPLTSQWGRRPRGRRRPKVVEFDV